MHHNDDDEDHKMYMMMMLMMMIPLDVSIRHCLMMKERIFRELAMSFLR